LQTYRLSYEREFFTEDARLLAQQLACGASLRAGFGWSLIGKGGAVLDAKGSIAGASLAPMLEAINHYRGDAEQLYLTVLPVAPVWDVSAVFKALERSNIQLLYAEQLCGEFETTGWLSRWHGNLEIAESNSVINRANSAVTRILDKNRPWVSYIYTADLSGGALPISTLLHDATFQARFRHIAAQARGIVAEPDLHSTLVQLDLKNTLGEQLPIFSDTDMSAVHQHCVNNAICNLIQLARGGRLSTVLNHAEVDECFYFVSTRQSAGGNNPPKTEEGLAAGHQGWNIISTEQVGSAACLLLEKAATPVASSDYWLN